MGCVREGGADPSPALVTPPTLQDFYQEVANPLLTAVDFEYPGNAVEEVTQDNFQLFFKGSEMVVAGKLRDQSPDVLSATVRGQLVSVAGHPGDEGQLERAFEGPGPNPSPTRLQPMDQEQSTKCPLPLGGGIGLHRLGSWWRCRAMMAGSSCPFCAGAVCQWHRAWHPLLSSHQPSAAALGRGGQLHFTDEQTEVQAEQVPLPWAPLQLGQELDSPRGALSLPRGHREPLSFHKEKLNRHTNKALQDGVSLTG